MQFLPASVHLLDRLQMVMNLSARLVFTSSKYSHITPLLQQLHWLKPTQRIDYKLAVLVLWKSAWDHSAISCRRILPVSSLRGLTTPAFHLVVISDRPTHTAVNHRRPRFSSRRCSCLERSATGRHVCAFSTCILQAPEVSSLQALFPLI